MPDNTELEKGKQENPILSRYVCKGVVYLELSYFIDNYIIIRAYSAFSLVASCVLLKYTRTDDVN